MKLGWIIPVLILNNCSGDKLIFSSFELDGMNVRNGFL